VKPKSAAARSYSTFGFAPASPSEPAINWSSNDNESRTEPPPDLTTSAEASSNVSAQRSRQCSADARRYADRNTRRTTATGAAGGAAIGAIASGSRRNTGRNAGRGALIGGGAGLLFLVAILAKFLGKKKSED
jgi:hypothetical protein